MREEVSKRYKQGLMNGMNYPKKSYKGVFSQKSKDMCR